MSFEEEMLKVYHATYAKALASGHAVAKAQADALSAALMSQMDFLRIQAAAKSE